MIPDTLSALAMLATGAAGISAWLQYLADAVNHYPRRWR